MAARPVSATFEDRSEPRDQTFHRTRLYDAQGAGHDAALVNVSLHGFMARCDTDFTVGEMLSVTMPVVGRFDAEVRWALGGRIGCRLLREIPPALYQFALVAMR